MIAWATVLKMYTIFRVADSAAATEGVNVTATVQVDPLASDAVHGAVPPDTAKSAAFVPVVAAGRVRLMDDDVLFVRVKSCAAVGVPTSCVPKLKLVGETEIAGIRGRSATYAFVAPVAPRDV